MTKVQLTLTDQETNILSDKASQLGYGLTRFIKFLISQEATQTLKNPSQISVFKMSKKAEKIALQAQKDHRKGKILLTNIGSHKQVY